MKRILEIILAVKSFACMAFAGFALGYGTVGWFFGVRQLSIGLIWQFMALSILIALLQFVFFSGNVVRRMRYSVRLVLFVIPLYLAVSAFAVVFHWFPLSLASWLIFSGIFLFIFAALVAVLEVYSRITGRQYNQLLNAYQSQNHT